MNSLWSFAGWLFIAVGVAFLVTGAIGLLRLPDLFTRLHAVTKADTVGLGLVVAGLACHTEGWQATIIMLTVWLLVMASGAVSCQLLARYGSRHGAGKQKGDSLDGGH